MRVLYLSSLVLGATALSAKPKGKHVDKAAARVGSKHVIAAHNKDKKVAKKVEAKKQTTESTETEVPVATFCIVNLLTQYFGLWTGLVLLRKYRETAGKEGDWADRWHQVFDEATASLSLAPAMAILFLAARYRAAQLAYPASPEAVGLPAPYAQTAMLVATWGVFAQMAMTFVRGMVISCFEHAPVTWAPYILNLFRHIIAAAVLGGTGVVCHGVIYMHSKDAPADVSLAVSPAVQCVIMLTVTYFAVVIALEVSRTVRQVDIPFLAFEGQSITWAIKVETWLKNAANAMSLSPMLALLFLAARMQAQANGMKGPAESTQQVMFATTYSMIASVLMNIILPLCFGASYEKSNMDSEMVVKMEGPLAAFFTFLNGCITFCIYGGFIYVVYTMINIAGLDVGVALSTGQQSVIFLINMYFSVLGLLWIFLALEKFQKAEAESFHRRCIDCLTAAKYTVAFAPMSAVLIMTANIRAGEITQGASPQLYVQSCMQYVTMAILAQLVMAVFGPFVGLTIQIEREGGIKADPSEGGSWFARTLVQIVSYASMIAMYAGVCGMVHGIYTMSPEVVQ